MSSGSTALIVVAALIASVGHPPAHQQPPPQSQSPWDNDPDEVTISDIAQAVQNEFGDADDRDGQDSRWGIRQREINEAKERRERELEEIQKLTENATFIDAAKEPAQPLDVAPKETPKSDDKGVIRDDDLPDALGDAHGPFVPDAVVPPVAPAASHLPLTVFTIGASGDVTARIYSDHALTVAKRDMAANIRGIIEPASAAVAAALKPLQVEASAPASRIRVTTIPMRAYCVEARKPAASQGAVYVWAPKAAQAQFASGRLVRRVAEEAARRAYLKPQGDPTAYAQFIVQYAVWTKLEHWDQQHFTREFVDRTRDQYREAHKPWTTETELTLRAIASARWADIRHVLNADATLEQRLRARGASVPTK